jgi:TorA maturation chaperone TorD
MQDKGQRCTAALTDTLAVTEYGLSMFRHRQWFTLKDGETMHDLITELIAQQLAYSFLSKALYESPEADFIQVLADDALFDEWPVDTDHPDVLAGLADLRAFVAQWQREDIGALKRDYARLFIGPDRLLAPPWESVYRSDEGLIFEKQTLEVRAQYQRFGMPIPMLNVEPDDHIGLELRFVAYLCALALEAIEANQPDTLSELIDAQRDFFADHLLQWAPDCLERIRTHAETAYFRGIAQLALGSLLVTTIRLNSPEVMTV